MKTKRIDGELYLDRKVKVFFKDETIPPKYKDKTKYAVIIMPINKNKGEK